MSPNICRGDRCEKLSSAGLVLEQEIQTAKLLKWNKFLADCSIIHPLHTPARLYGGRGMPQALF